MPFVLDASTTMAWCFADESTPYTQYILSLLRDTYAEVPPVWTFEVANVLAVSERRKRITAAGSDEFLQTLAGLDIRVEQSRPPVNGNALLPLSRRYGLTAYDAAYLELAKRKVLPLATIDRDLHAAASKDGIAVLREQESTNTA
jgi:predicted nucleic acid-binding protein